MTMKQMKLWVLTVTLVCGTMTFMTGCKEAKDNGTARLFAGTS